jgi:hypothetical protein
MYQTGSTSTYESESGFPKTGSMLELKWMGCVTSFDRNSSIFKGPSTYLDCGLS